MDLLDVYIVYYVTMSIENDSWVAFGKFTKLQKSFWLYIYVTMNSIPVNHSVH